MYSLSVDQNIIDIYSVKYEHNRDAVNNANWNTWKLDNIAYKIDSSEPSYLDTPTLVHNPKTPLTDMLDIHRFPGKGCVVSQKFVKLLEKFTLPKIKTFPIKINYKSEIHTYYYLFFLEDFTSKIDFSKTLFDVKTNKGSKRNTLININEWNEAFRNQDRFEVKAKDFKSKIYFTHFNEDFFSLQRIYFNSLIVSEPLQNAMEKELFGLRFRKCENYYLAT